MRVCVCHNSGNFHAKNFRVKIFSWSTMPHENLLTTEFYYNEKIIRTKIFFRPHGAFPALVSDRTVAATMEELKRDACIRGYHIYKEVWEAADGEELPCEREPQNSKDRYAVAVKRKGIVVGHLPRKIARLCLLFLRRGGMICFT